MRQVEKAAAGAQDLQQVVQFPQSDHLLLYIHLTAEVVTLKSSCRNTAVAVNTYSCVHKFTRLVESENVFSFLFLNKRDHSNCILFII